MKDKMYYITESIRIAGLKQGTKKAPLYYQAWYGGVVIDENSSIALLKHRCKGLKVKIKGVY
jgi:hypothetical protein